MGLIDIFRRKKKHNIKFEIGAIEGDGFQKYIISQRDENTLEYYAHQETDEIEYHSDIADKFKVSAIGGGMCRRDGSEISIWGMSGSYGRVPMIVLKNFEEPILEAYKKLFPEVKSVKFGRDLPYHGEWWDTIVDKIK